MGRVFGFIVFLAVVLGFEYYCYQGLQEIFNNSNLFNWIYIISILIFLYGFSRAISQFRSTIRTLTSNLIIGIGFSIFISKLFLCIGFLFRDLLSLLIGLGAYLSSFFTENNISESFIPGHPAWSSYLILGFGVLPFISMLYGITKGKYRYTVSNVKLKIKNLPKTFSGFRIAQISDIHSGTFDSIKQVEKGVKMLNDEKPDLFVFTGDLINFHKDEIDPFIGTFAKIEAPFGKYSILGNHDYYGMQNVPKEERHNYFNQFAEKHEQIGFNLLRNENVQIRKGKDSLNLIGVENWGVGGFPKTGDLDKALMGSKKEDINILLSHDPSHWDHVVLPHAEKIDITMSGHTHGMQFGINFLGIKWSPVQYRYKRWMGLYEENNQKLYVNRGFGFLGFPGRVFMWPEITIFELEAE